jgi:hypothetical protein
MTYNHKTLTRRKHSKSQSSPQRPPKSATDVSRSLITTNPEHTTSPQLSSNSSRPSLLSRMTATPSEPLSPHIAECLIASTTSGMLQDREGLSNSQYLHTSPTTLYCGMRRSRANHQSFSMILKMPYLRTKLSLLQRLSDPPRTNHLFTL